MNLKTVLAMTDSKDSTENEQQSPSRCECGEQLQNTVVAGVRHVNDELRLYCAKCL